MRRHLRTLSIRAMFLVPAAALLLTLLPPGVAEAAVASGPAFSSSAVPCLNSAPPLAITRHEDTIFDDPQPATYSGLQTLTAGAPPVTQAMLSGIGSTYSIAYDDGAVSGRERLYVAAYSRRLVAYGPLGAGGVYAFDRGGAGWSYSPAASFQVPGATAAAHGPVGSTDRAAVAGVGATSLGGMTISPDGRFLYVVNIGPDRIEQYALGAGQPAHIGALTPDYTTLSTDAAARAEMVPFALEWWPHTDPSGNPVLILGVTDTMRRSATNTTAPRIYVMSTVLNQGGQATGWSRSLEQDLGVPSLRDRLDGSSFVTELPPMVQRRLKGWNAWTNDFNTMVTIGNELRYPQPLLTNIAFLRDTAPSDTAAEPIPLMALGIRDRTGDIAFNNAIIPAGEHTAIAQGDLLGYRLSGGQWELAGAGPDYFNDNALPNGGANKHIENMAGALARIPDTGTSISGAGDALVSLGLMGLRTSGLYTWAGDADSGGTPTPSNTLIGINARGATKATNLGDVEVLCSYALVGGRVWADGNGNGVRESGDAPIPGVTLDLFQGSDALSAPSVTSVTTDAAGRYLLAVRPNTSYNIRVSSASRAALRQAGYRQYSRAHAFGNPNGLARATNDSDLNPTRGYIEFSRPGQGTTTSRLTPLWSGADLRSFDIGVTRVLPTSAIGDRVWNDLDADGVQDAGEPGVRDVPVTLESTGALLQSVNTSMVTDSNGSYYFRDLAPGTYRVRVAAPAGYQLTRMDQGGDDTRDSDASAGSGLATAWFEVGPNENQGQWDFGLTGGADPWVRKSVSSPAALLAQQFTYTLSYGNRQGVAHNVVIRDALPAGLAYVSATPAPSSITGRSLAWSLGSLSAGAAGSIRITVRAPAALSPASATQQAYQNCATVTTTTTDTNPTDPDRCVDVTVQRPELTITKSAPAAVVVGDDFAYGLTFANVGAAAAANVVVSDSLPSGVTFGAFTLNPSSICAFDSAARRVSCAAGTLPPGATRAVSFTARADSTAAATVVNAAMIGGPNGAPIPGDNPADNTGTAATAVQLPNPGVRVTIAPGPFPVGDSGSITLSFTNTGTGPARASRIEATIPAAAAIGAALPAGCAVTATTAAARVVTCSLGDLAAGGAGAGSRSIPIALPPTFLADQLDVTATIVTATPERAADLGDNTSSGSAAVMRPNPFVTVAATTKSAPERGPAGWRSFVRYRVGYGNDVANPDPRRAALERARPSDRTWPAATTVLTATLPAGATLSAVTDAAGAALGGYTTSTDAQGRTALRLELGTLAARAAGAVLITVEAAASPGASLELSGEIRTASAGDDAADNAASDSTGVAQPPADIEQAGGDIRLAIRSELDPNAADTDPRNGVYVSTGRQIMWPAGEILNFTPRLVGLSLPDEASSGDPLSPYGYRARILGWSVVGLGDGGPQLLDPAARADGRGRIGCRMAGDATPPRAGSLLSGCGYSYIGAQGGGVAPSQLLAGQDAGLTEAAVARQARAYWSTQALPGLRDEVFAYTTFDRALRPVRVQVAVEVEVEVVNLHPCAPLNDWSCPPAADPSFPRERQVLADTFTVSLLAPRTVVGPGGARPGAPPAR